MLATPNASSGAHSRDPVAHAGTCCRRRFIPNLWRAAVSAWASSGQASRSENNTAFLKLRLHPIVAGAP